MEGARGRNFRTLCWRLADPYSLLDIESSVIAPPRHSVPLHVSSQLINFNTWRAPSADDLCSLGKLTTHLEYTVDVPTRSMGLGPTGRSLGKKNGLYNIGYIDVSGDTTSSVMQDRYQLVILLFDTLLLVLIAWRERSLAC